MESVTLRVPVPPLPDDDLVRFLFVSDEPAACDLAVVFGAADPAEATRRAVRGAGLCRAGFAPRLLFTGGDPAERGVSEAAAMADLAIRMGVPATAILIEDRSNTTAENVARCRELLDRDGLLAEARSLLLVSAWWHLRRARALVRRGFGDAVRLVCVPASDDLDTEWARSQAGRELLTWERELVRRVES